MWLGRALQLARHASPVAIEPNPPVGAVIAAEEVLLGEGYHRFFGGPHAEIEALQRVKDSTLLSDATLYVTLEPCCHEGKKTPPCVPALVAAGIRRVVVGCTDPNPAVSGKGIQSLQAAGVEVLLAPDPRPFRLLLRHFRVNLQKGRPYITLKWAQAQNDGAPFIGSRTQGRWPISDFWGLVWAHKLRAQHSHIGIGYGTWRLDQPALTTRFFPGESPHVLVFYDPQYGLPPEANNQFIPLSASLRDTVEMLYLERHVGSLLIEGGARLLNRFLAAQLYDEVHIIVRKGVHPPSDPVLAPLPPSLRWKRYYLSPNEVVWRGRL
ncbi:MAG: bifunctional diaminohydroxyphosphoribosylaminopyrimidine deaminase/5-amino-6-(5-phosphoribosylamino)uracil reductase RibD [Bacteroidia bacterium]|nr:bifunctional diaminohydroxyphosphoribosylaminopyrimidine deaminase/5-amino-6-(5-phosphoribosylamino)uracil reductase RibD [Bacteroidia bacterium]MDW8014851.1 bifunctional diaminohydroxyphosphoribosylaminopyrimidine deaminase/5-amino-6-(5-phosphoribosylamino)uracil reductase RibD [Bacteroidia bacterium]